MIFICYIQLRPNIIPLRTYPSSPSLYIQQLLQTFFMEWPSTILPLPNSAISDRVPNSSFESTGVRNDNKLLARYKPAHTRTNCIDKPIYSRSADTSLACPMHFAIPTDVFNGNRLYPLAHWTMLVFGNTDQTILFQLSFRHYVRLSTVSQQWIQCFLTNPIRSTLQEI